MTSMRGVLLLCVANAVAAVAATTPWITTPWISSRCLLMCRGPIRQCALVAGPPFSAVPISHCANGIVFEPTEWCHDWLQSVRSCRRIEWCRLQCPVPSTEALLKLRFPLASLISIVGCWVLGAYGPHWVAICCSVVLFVLMELLEISISTVC